MSNQGQSSAETTSQHSSNQVILQPSSANTLGHERPLIGLSGSGITERGERGSNSEVMIVPLSNSSLTFGSPHSSISSKPSAQLPTPQSPKDFGQYISGVPYNPESPVPNKFDPLLLHYSALSSRPTPTSSSNMSLVPTSTGQGSGFQRYAAEDARISAHSVYQQTITPESSPLQRTTPRNAATPRYNSPLNYTQNTVPRGNNTPIKLEPPTLTLAPAFRISSPVSSPIEPRLSSPFMAKLSIADKTAKSKTPNRSRPQSHTPERRPMQIDDVFSSPAVTNNSGRTHLRSASSISTPPLSPPQPLAPPGSTAGGEMERIRQAMMQERLARFQETESRRPEYLTRTKRTLSEADPTAFAEDEHLRDQERAVAVGIMESPNKGRRLKLFQETSEESFEESLMAGGYGRYRTADWVRQPQPLTLVTPGPAGPSNVIAILEEAEEAPPSDKELKKRKRLAAFRGERTPYDGPASKLFPVELEGRGRVLLDVPAEEPTAAVPEPTPTKKRGGSRRKKRGAEPTAKEKKALAVAAAAENVEKPNWPDVEFPWRLRTEERAGMAKAEEEEKLRWIERFLDRESDEEEDAEVVTGTTDNMQDEDDAPQATSWSMIYEDDAGRLPQRGGRGKMVPLLANPVGGRMRVKKKSAFFPSDPADARAALLSKKSVRALSYRRQRRQRQTENESDDEVVCVCNGRDDGRELVQCDGCETWYHLQCIGIRNIAELGKEEDPWFCQECTMIPEPEIMSREPTFVPTDDGPRVSHIYDPPFFQPSLQDSPMAWNPPSMPKTPTRSRRSADFGQGFSSGSSWVESSRHGPSTPQYPSQGIKVYTNNTPGPFDTYDHSYDESPFDPTSTPSRGIKFSAPFATPKNNVWSMRANGLFQTPSKNSSGRSLLTKTFGGPGSLSSALDDSAGGSNSSHSFGRMAHYDESPIRRARSGEGPRTRRVVDSPLALRSIGSLPPHLLEDSPVMRLKGKERRHDPGRPFEDAP